MAGKSFYTLMVDLAANTAQLQQDMDKAVGLLQRSGGRISQVMQGIGQGIGQALGQFAVQNVKNLTTALSDLADKGEEAGSIADTFKKLGGSSSAIEEARKSVRGMVSEFDLMKVANQAIITGLPNLNKNFSLLADYAGRFANATGRDTLEVLDSLTRAIGSGANKSLREFGIQVDEGATRSEKMAQAIEQLSSNMNNFDAVTNSVSNAHKALSVAMEDALKNIGIGINENEALTEVYRNLADAVQSVDWREVGDGIANMAAQVAELLPSLSTMVGLIEDAGRAMRFLSGDMTRKDALGKAANDVAAEIADLRKEIELRKQNSAVGGFIPSKGAQLIDQVFGTELSGYSSEKTAQLEGLLAERQKQLLGISEEIKKIDDAAKKSPILGPADPSSLGMIFNSSKGAWESRTAMFGGGSVESSRAKAAKKTNKEIADDRVEQEERAEAEIQRNRAWASEERIRNELEARKQLEAYYGLDDQGVQSSWSRVFSDAAASFGGDLGHELSSVFDQFSHQVDGVMNRLIDSFTRISTSDAYQQGIQGPGWQDGMFTPPTANGPIYAAFAQQIFSAIGAAMNAKSIDKQTQSSQGTVTAVLGNTVVGQIAGAIAGHFFKWGPQNPETQARHEFANWMEEALKKIGGFMVRQPDGTFNRMTNFIEGSSGRFNKPGWADDFNKKPGAATFRGLGMGLKEILGITEDVGDQIASMLGENLANNVDNARHLVQQLGLSFEEVQDKLVEMGKRGEKTWLEVETGIQGAADAFKPGLAAVGDWNQAMQNLLNSGARGYEAIQSVRDIFIEAGEKGIKNMEQLRQEMLKTYDPKIVDAFFQAAAQRGVTSIEAGMKLDDRTAGGFVADMQAAGVKFKEAGDKVSDSMGSLNSATSSNTSATLENTRALQALSAGKKFTPSVDDGGDGTETESARGNVFYGPRRTLMGESGPEAILPLTRKNGRLGVSVHGLGNAGGGYVVHIDARGAAPGVENRIRAAIRESEERVSRGILKTLSSQRRRAV